jgi:hypothetical protein
MASDRNNPLVHTPQLTPELTKSAAKTKLKEIWVFLTIYFKYWIAIDVNQTTVDGFLFLFVVCVIMLLIIKFWIPLLLLMLFVIFLAQV